MTQPRTSFQSAARHTPPAERRPGPILVAVGDDDGSTAALRIARALARRGDAELRVLTVVEPLPPYFPGVGMEPMPPGLEGDARTRALRDVRDRMREATGDEETWPIEIASGHVARTIARVARGQHARLVVMGIGRHALGDRLFGGERTLQTVRLAHCPVLAVSPRADDLPRRATVGVDFSPASVRAAEVASALLGEDATLSLVHVKPRLEESELDKAAWDATYSARVVELFDRLRADLQPRPGVTVETVSLEGWPADQLLAFATRSRAELIATGTHGYGFVERLFLGSVATGVLRGAACSVLIAPEPSGADAERIRRHLTGTVDAPEPGRWAPMLDAFTRRNAGRRVALEVDDPDVGAQIQESGYVLLGTTYDRHDGRVEIMLGSGSRRGPHLTRTIDGVDSVSILSGADGEDRALRVEHGTGQTLVTFLP
jgi:nucleotide-binding universal stress UspA family protein